MGFHQGEGGSWAPPAPLLYESELASGMLGIAVKISSSLKMTTAQMKSLGGFLRVEGGPIEWLGAMVVKTP
jgi:hypothetical protein